MAPGRWTAVAVAAWLIFGSATFLLLALLAGRGAPSWEGLLFVAMSAPLVGGATWALTRRIGEQIRALIQHRDALVRAERRAVASTLSAAIAHDCNNLLMLLSHLGSTLEVQVHGDPKASKTVADLRAITGRLATLARRLHSAGGQRLVTAPVERDIMALTQGELDLLRKHQDLHQRALRLEGEPTRATLYEPLFQQLITNLVLNAAHVVGPSGTVEVRVARSPDGAVIEVHDDGPGVPPELRERIFEPLYTTRDEGTGLGLVSARACAQAHSGHIEVLDSPLGGALFRVSLHNVPVAPAAQEPLFEIFTEPPAPILSREDS